MMNRLALTLSLVTATIFAVSPVSAAGGDGPKPPALNWSFAGPFGHYDNAQLQRGFKVYREVCASCHGLTRIAFRTLAQEGGPEFSPEQIQALAAQYKIQDGPNDAGEMFERPGRPADRFPSPFANPQQAASANNGKAPPDLSVITKARTYERGFPWFIFDIFTQTHEVIGPNYVAAFLKGYVDPPKDFVVPTGAHYNLYYPGHVVAMPNVLSDGLVEYPKDANGVPSAPETKAQYARDVTAFLNWTSEPHLEQRKQTGFFFLSILAVLAALLYFTKKRIWSRLGSDGAP
jgi:ubiquinol-cytochrome c reductase cytochrome c1 subunit